MWYETVVASGIRCTDISKETSNVHKTFHYVLRSSDAHALGTGRIVIPKVLIIMCDLQLNMLEISFAMNPFDITMVMCHCRSIPSYFGLLFVHDKTADWTGEGHCLEWNLNAQMNETLLKTPKFIASWATRKCSDILLAVHDKHSPLLW